MWDTIITGLRAHVKDAFAASHSGVPLVFDNDAFDWNNPPENFVEFEIKFYDGRQIGAAANPRTRAHGYVYATAYSRKGTGVLKSVHQLQTLASLLAYAEVAGVKLQAPELIDGTERVAGWNLEQLKVAFYADQP